MRPEGLRQPAEPDRLPLLDRRSAGVAGAHGQDLGDDLRSAAASCAYDAAVKYEEHLRHIERSLVAAASRGQFHGDSVFEMTLDIVRTFMVRGLMQAQLEAGDHMAFWVRR